VNGSRSHQRGMSMGWGEASTAGLSADYLEHMRGVAQQGHTAE
jgi:hypothetical protein